MKYLKIVLIYFLFLGISGCDYRDIGSYSYESRYTPVIMERSELEQSIKLVGPQSIKDYGKIYIKDSLLFINEGSL